MPSTRASMKNYSYFFNLRKIILIVKNELHQHVMI